MPPHSLRLISTSLGLLLALNVASEDKKIDSLSGMEIQSLFAIPQTPQAPDFTLTDANGETHTLSDYRGKIVIVNFWAVWCAPCRKEMPSMQRAWEKIQHKDAVMLAVNWGDNTESVDRFMESIDVNLEFPILLGGDKEMALEWSVKGLPTTFVIDPEGRLVYKVVGDIEWDDSKILEKVLHLNRF
jgi:peroxiredoxin